MKRTKVTAESYDNLKKVRDTVPKSSKGSDAVREAMNVSVGTWHYLRESTDYENFKFISSAANRSHRVERPRQVELPVDKPVPSDGDIVSAIDRVTDAINRSNTTLIRLCVAWETTPQQKKSWLK